MKPIASPHETVQSDKFAPKTGESRIWFAQMLRGVAVLCVVFWHFGEVFWKDNAYVCHQVHLPPLELTSRPFYLGLIGWLGHNRIEIGEFGVALFFLISGFVIPFSLLKVGNWKFFIRRCFRIYPTYLLGLSFTCAVLLFTSQYTGIPTGLTLGGFLCNAIPALRHISPLHHRRVLIGPLSSRCAFIFICMLITSHFESSDSAVTPWHRYRCTIMCASEPRALH